MQTKDKNSVGASNINMFQCQIETSPTAEFSSTPKLLSQFRSVLCVPLLTRVLGRLYLTFWHKLIQLLKPVGNYDENLPSTGYTLAASLLFFFSFLFVVVFFQVTERIHGRLLQQDIVVPLFPLHCYNALCLGVLAGRCPLMLLYLFGILCMFFCCLCFRHTITLTVIMKQCLQSHYRSANLGGKLCSSHWIMHILWINILPL